MEFLTSLLDLLNNPIMQILAVCYSILSFMMPFFVIRISLKCDKLEQEIKSLKTEENNTTTTL